MTSQDDLTLLKRMHGRGEISDEQYDVLRRHVLWGTPLPQLIDEIPTPRSGARSPGTAPPGTAPPGTAPPGGGYPGGGYPGGTGIPPGSGRPPPPGSPPPPAPGSRQARREAAEAEERAFSPSALLPPVTPDLPPRGPTSPAYPSAYSPPGPRRPDPDPRREPPNPYAPPAHRTPAGPDLHSRREGPPSSYPADQDRRAAREPTAPDGRRSGYVPSGHRPAGPPPEPAEHPASGWSRDEDGADPGTRRPRRGEPVERSGRSEPAERSGRSEPAERSGRSEPAERSRRSDDPVEAPSRRSRRDAERDGRRSRRDDGPAGGWSGREDEPAGTRPRRAAGDAGDRLAPEPDGATRAADDPGRPRPRRRRSVFAVLTSVVLALALAAAGVYWFVLRDAGVRPAEYARAVCGSVRDWQAAVDSGSGVLVTRIARDDDRTAVRTAVATYYTDLAGRTDGLRTAVVDAGVADVAGGQAYADSLATAVGDQSTVLRDLSTRAGRLDPDAAATFQIQLQSLLTGSETAVGTISAALSRPAAGTPAALRTALGAEPACAPYVG